MSEREGGKEGGREEERKRQREKDREKEREGERPIRGRAAKGRRQLELPIKARHSRMDRGVRGTWHLEVCQRARSLCVSELRARV